jgi:hypothetical protein
VVFHLRGGDHKHATDLLAQALLLHAQVRSHSVRARSKNFR